MSDYIQKTAVMQPYFFPYIGYYQLINAVDTFVILDDVNYIMRGWINRNNILLNNKAHMISVPLSKPSQNKLIMETQINFTEKSKDSFIRTVDMAYKKAPFFKCVFPLFLEIMEYKDNDLTAFLENSIKRVLSYLNIEKKITRSSLFSKDSSLKAQERIIEICKLLGTDLYINPIGGVTLYDSDKFKKESIDLKFIKTNFDTICYKQMNGEFVGGLSFIDVLMFNPVDRIHTFLQQYCLVESKDV